MKYEIGDKVIIKKYESYWNNIQKYLQKNNYIVTIKDIELDRYRLKEVDCLWSESDIEGLVPEPEKFFELELITRFELMEL